MASAQVRRFTFFDKEVLKDPETNQPFNSFQGLGIRAATSGRGLMIFGDSEGIIHQVDRGLQISSFQGFMYEVTHLVQIQRHNILVGVGSDDEGIAPLVKIWDFDKVDRNGSPRLMYWHSVKVTRTRPVPVSVVAASEDLNHIAVGLYDGSVLVYTGTLTRVRIGSSKTPRVVHEGNSPVTGVGFKQVQRDTVLFVTSSTQVTSYFLGRKGHQMELDSLGGELRCSVVSDTADGFVVARAEGIYAYEPEGRGFALGFDGEKKILTCFRNYLVIVGREGARADASSSVSRINTVTIYDMQNKFIAFAAGFNDVTHVMHEWGSLFVLTGDGKMYQLSEKDFQTKLDMLFRKHLYEIAISLAKTQSTPSAMVEIYKVYAEHLYAKGNYNDAIAQYIKTIGSLEPSYVIRKFLDSQRIHNLTAYLKALHDEELADKHHTTLLLNCYTKLKDQKMLDEFIMTDKHLNFDLETAIKVCRHAGYFTHAVFLAKKFKQHDWYLKIQLEDVKQYQAALDYISTLPFPEAEKNLKAYGKELVNQMPEATTDLLMRLCTGYTVAGAMEGGLPDKAKPEEFIHTFVNQIPSLLRFLEHMVTAQPDSAPQVYDTLLELYLQSKVDKGKPDAARQHEIRVMDLLQNPNAKYDNHHAMVLAQVYDFKPGILYLYEKAKQYQQIVQYYMEKDAYVEIIDACKKYGTADRNLWVQALSYFAAKEDDCKAQISEVLAHIDKRNLLPPLMVVDVLARNSNATLAVIKDYITRRLQQEDHAIAEDERKIRQYRQETKQMRQQISDLKTNAKVFQDMKCSCCKMPLEMPAVYFLCGCSYNQRCLVGMDREECIKCADDRKKVLDIVDAQASYADHHEQFFKQLDGASNRFGVVADYFGKGVFNKITLISGNAPSQSPLPTQARPGASLGSRGGIDDDIGDVQEVNLGLGVAGKIEVAPRGSPASSRRGGGYSPPTQRARPGGYGGGGPGRGGYGGGDGGGYGGGGGGGYRGYGQ